MPTSRRVKALQSQQKKMGEGIRKGRGYDLGSTSGGNLFDSNGVLTTLNRTPSYYETNASVLLATDGVQIALTDQINFTCDVGDTILTLGKIGLANKRMQLESSGDITDVYANNSGVVMGVQTAATTIQSANLWGTPVGTTNVTVTNIQLIVIVIKQ